MVEIHKELFFFPERFISTWVICYGKVSPQLKFITVLPECLGSVTAIAVWGRELQAGLDCILA